MYIYIFSFLPKAAIKYLLNQFTISIFFYKYYWQIAFFKKLQSIKPEICNPFIDLLDLFIVRFFLKLPLSFSFIFLTLLLRFWYSSLTCLSKQICCLCILSISVIFFLLSIFFIDCIRSFGHSLVS